MEGLRSAWLEWARAAEMQQILARATREYGALGNTHDDTRTDNADDVSNPIFSAHRKLRTKRPHPARWSVLMGDVLTNFRAALDHAVWYAVNARSGRPPNPQHVAFPICTVPKKFKDRRQGVGRADLPRGLGSRRAGAEGAPGRRVLCTRIYRPVHKRASGYRTGAGLRSCAGVPPRATLPA